MKMKKGNPLYTGRRRRCMRDVKALRLYKRKHGHLLVIPGFLLNDERAVRQ